jgi:hypothetical protein
MIAFYQQSGLSIIIDEHNSKGCTMYKSGHNRYKAITNDSEKFKEIVYARILTKLSVQCVIMVLNLLTLTKD